MQRTIKSRLESKSKKDTQLSLSKSEAQLILRLRQMQKSGDELAVIEISASGPHCRKVLQKEF